MSEAVADRVRTAVAAVTDPELRRPIGELDMVRDIAVRDGVAEVGIALTIVGCPAADRIERDVRAAAASVAGVSSVEVAVRDSAMRHQTTAPSSVGLVTFT